MMTELPHPTFELITQYLTALKSCDTVAMHALRSPDFVLDWVHGDAFASKPLNQTETNSFWTPWFAAFSDMDYEVSRTILAETVAVVQWMFTGTHDHILGLPIFEPAVDPTGKVIAIRGVSIYDIEGGQIQKETIYIDQATLWVELGVAV
jgi:steroid delta-isomerase-like uncharacterized protein